MIKIKMWREQLRVVEDAGEAVLVENSDSWYFREVHIDVQCLSTTVKAFFALLLDYSR